jgi:hypothetical protein
LKSVDFISYSKKLPDYEIPFPLPNQLKIGFNPLIVEYLKGQTKLGFPKNNSGAYMNLINWNLIHSKKELYNILEKVIFSVIYYNDEIKDILRNSDKSQNSDKHYQDIMKILNTYVGTTDYIMASKKLVMELKKEEYFKTFQDFDQNIDELLAFFLEINATQLAFKGGGYTILNDFNKAEELIKLLTKISYLGRFLVLGWLKDDKDFNFSSGENAILRIFSSLLVVKNKLNNRDRDNILLIIDEGELGMHPQWQKNYLKTLLDVLPKIFKDKKIQIILTSHSPFLVSDLPKESIIFLKKGKKGKKLPNGLDAEGNCIVAKRDEQTFGQNIHTLFADSFFMEGTMGEFAKNKILDLVDFLVGKKGAKPFTQELARQIINMVGETLIQTKLANLYQNKFGDSPFETLDELIAKYQKKIVELQNQKLL